ncbi:MAG: murein biosynthesis integral membrane protein MurJ [Candidatus Shapirobacteria bacterium]|jgi:putative peptidoglycan lipid II flippase
MGFHDQIKSLGTKKQHSILSASLVLAITFGLSAILGFLRSRFLYAHFFSCCVLELDAYNAAFRLPDLIFKLLVTGALSASFIPVFSTYLHKDEKKAYEVASTVINLLLIFFTIASITVLIFTKPLSGIIAHGFTVEQIDLMTNLTRILLVAQIFFLISNFLTGMLQVHQVFVVPALSPIVYNIFIILSIFFLVPSMGIYGVAIGCVIGAFFHLLIQIPVAKALGVKYSFTIQPKLAGVKEVVRLMIPRSLSLGLGEIENTVTLFFASSLTAGSISLLNLALQLMYLPSRIFGTTVGQASLPMLSKNIARNEMDIFRNTVKKTISQSLYIAVPITVLVLVHRLAIIRIAFGAKQFPWSATLLTAKTLAYLTPAIVSQAVIQILVRAFYAIHDTKTPLKISFFSLLVNVVSSFIFVNYTDLGILGLAISASLGNLTQCFGLFYSFVRIVDGAGWEKTFFHYFKIIIASAILGFTSWACMRFFDMFVLDTTRTLNLIILSSISVMISLVFYFYSSKILNISEVDDYRHYFGKFTAFFKK